MSTFQEQLLSALAKGPDGAPIPESKLVYLQERLKGRFFDFLVERFEIAQAMGLNQAKLARRINKPAAVINRWLGAPSNLTLESISDLLAGIDASEMEMSASSLLNRAPTNYWHDADFTAREMKLPDLESATTSSDRAIELPSFKAA